MKRRDFISSSSLFLLGASFRVGHTSTGFYSNRILIEAHRGDSVNAPENTMAAFESAIKQGVDRIEVDLRITTDKHLVIMHDETIDRTTNGTGKVAELTYKYLSSCDAGEWKSPGFKGERIPRLSDVFELCRGRVMVNIDLKDEKAVRPMLETIKEMRMEDWVVITGLIPQCVDLIREEGSFLTMFYESDNNLVRLQKGEKIKAMEHAISQARRYGLPGFLFPVDFISEEIVYMAHKHGLCVNVWDVNTRDQVDAMVRTGVDALMTDDPGMVKQHLRNFRF